MIHINVGCSNADLSVIIFKAVCERELHNLRPSLSCSATEAAWEHTFHMSKTMGLILLLIVLVLLFGGGGFYVGPPFHYYGGGLSLILVIVILVIVFRR